jgi:thioredoxin-related protein
MLIGFLCITITLIGYKVELERRKNLIELQSYTMQIEEKNRIRELLFNKFYTYLMQKIEILDDNSIRNYLKDNFNFEPIIGDTENSMVYMKEESVLILKYPYDSSYNNYEFYSIHINEGKLKFTRIQNVIVKNSKNI